MVIAKLCSPCWKSCAQPREYSRSDIEFDAMTLAIIKTDRLNPIISIKRPGETGCGVLSARKENERGWVGHDQASVPWKGAARNRLKPIQWAQRPGAPKPRLATRLRRMI
jgi:hypothetical protein